MLIEDGAGKGNRAKVDSNLRIHAQTVEETESQHAAEIGDAYNINTGNITFSAAGTMVYFKNGETKDFVVEAVAVGLGSGTTSDSPEITVERNPTGGDLISDGTAVDMKQNRNFGSSKTLATGTLVYKGKSGGTSTGADDTILFYQTAAGRLYAPINLVITPGSSMAITIDPKLSSGSIKAYAAIIGHLKDEASQD
jgi:hypothetical protein